MTKSELLRRANGLGPGDQLIPMGPQTEDRIAMPIEVILDSILEAMGDLKPGKNAKLTDFAVLGDRVSVSLSRGEFKKERTISRKVLEMFGSDSIDPDCDGEFE